jgi:hypothetical protein
MSSSLKFAVAMLARVVGTIAEQLAQWLFHQVSTGTESGLDLLDDLRQFARRFLRMVAGQFCGRSRTHYDEYGEEWQPGLYRS